MLHQNPHPIFESVVLSCVVQILVYHWFCSWFCSKSGMQTQNDILYKTLFCVFKQENIMLLLQANKGIRANQIEQNSFVCTLAHSSSV